MGVIDLLAFVLIEVSEPSDALIEWEFADFVALAIFRVIAEWALEGESREHGSDKGDVVVGTRLSCGKIGIP